MKITECQWIGEQKTAPFTHCGAEVVEGRSYCEHHLWQVYQQGSAVRRRKDARRAAAVWDLQSAFNEAVQELEEEGFDFSLERWEPIES